VSTPNAPSPGGQGWNRPSGGTRSGVRRSVMATGRVTCYSGFSVPGRPASPRRCSVKRRSGRSVTARVRGLWTLAGCAEVADPGRVAAAREPSVERGRSLATTMFCVPAMSSLWSASRWRQPIRRPDNPPRS